MAYVFVVYGPYINAQVDEVCVRVRVSLAFCNSLEFGLGLSTEAELGRHDRLPEFQDNVVYKCVDKLVGSELNKSIEKVVFEVLLPQFDKVIRVDAL